MEKIDLEIIDKSENSDKNFNVKMHNISTSHNKIKQKKNDFNLNFIEYCVFYLYMCFGKRQYSRIHNKMSLLENSSDFADYYLDVNTYIKKMMEIDLLKIYVIKNKEELNFIDNFKPSMKHTYSDLYQEKLNNLYQNRLTNNKQDEAIENIRKMKIEDPRIYENILSFMKQN